MLAMKHTYVLFQSIVIGLAKSVSIVNNDLYIDKMIVV